MRPTAGGWPEVSSLAHFSAHVSLLASSLTSAAARLSGARQVASDPPIDQRLRKVFRSQAFLRRSRSIRRCIGR